MAPVLGYWKIRGLAQPIRNLLAYTGTEFEDKFYELGADKDYFKTEWNLKDKANLGLPFANIPYYIDKEAGVKLCQSGSIIRYLARKNNLIGETEEQKQLVDMAECQLEDFRSVYVSLCYNPNFETEKHAYVDGVPESFFSRSLSSKLENWSDFLGDRKWLAGDKLTFVDFLVYEMLDQHKVVVPGCLDKFANLQEYTKRFESLENIKKYMNSGKFIKTAFHNKSAACCNK